MRICWSVIGSSCTGAVDIMQAFNIIPIMPRPSAVASETNALHLGNKALRMDSNAGTASASNGNSWHNTSPSNFAAMLTLSWDRRKLKENPAGPPAPLGTTLEGSVQRWGVGSITLARFAHNLGDAPVFPGAGCEAPPLKPRHKSVI